MPDATDPIRHLRQQSNSAIAARDVDRVVSIMDPDIVVAVAGGPVLRGLKASRDAFAEQFAERGFLGYVRTPEVITLHDPPTGATERGTWSGRWQTASGVHTQSGRYSATWQHSMMGWRLVAETFSTDG